ncbi:MAG: purine-nucleoside phosphorylase [Sulfurovum sp.]|nr:purine-nucleoside phosphorylase [Sulfurovum sp.]MCB4759987.1 purine-nucleoside phosphorylase [Sulfurovum sp.]
MIICAGKSEQFDFASPIGIGMVESAINLTRICEQKKPDHMVFVATAGSYGEKKIFEIIKSHIATNIEQGFFDGNAYTPIDNIIETIENVSCETLVNSSNYITTNKKIWSHYIAQNIHLENMEFYAVMKVAQMYDIPTTGIFIVTNYCDENAHRDFKKNHAEAMERLSTYVNACSIV